MILKRNIILFAICALYMLINMSLASLFFDTKINKIQELETKHISVNESYITAQILSSSLDKVYTIFEKNLATSSKDDINKEASMEFLKELTDIIERLNIKLDQIIPGKKIKKGVQNHIPYRINIKCDYEKLGEFITELESNDRIILIDEIILKNELDKTNRRDKSQQKILEQDVEMKILTVTLNKTKTL